MKINKTDLTNRIISFELFSFWLFTSSSYLRSYLKDIFWGGKVFLEHFLNSF